MTQASMRMALFIALLVLGVGYIFAYALFVEQSRDFVVAEENARARDFSASHPVTIPSTIPFDSASPWVKLLGGGWHRTQPDGTWSSMNESFVAFHVPRSAGPLHLRIQSDSLVTAHHARQTLGLSANGNLLLTKVRTSDDSSNPIDLVIPASEIGDGYISLEFYADKLTVPLATGAGLDSRALGLRLRSIEFLPPAIQ